MLSMEPSADGSEDFISQTGCKSRLYRELWDTFWHHLSSRNLFETHISFARDRTWQPELSIGGSPLYFYRCSVWKTRRCRVKDRRPIWIINTTAYYCSWFTSLLSSATDIGEAVLCQSVSSLRHKLWLRDSMRWTLKGWTAVTIN